LQLSLTEYDNDAYPIYTVNEVDDSNPFPVDIKRNTIPIFVEKNPIVRADRKGSHRTPQVFPSIVLVFNNGWNDYGIRSYFIMCYNDKNQNYHEIGAVNIINQEESTPDIIPEEFVQLDEKFCSLGQDTKYYKDLNDLLGKDFIGVLYALRDAAFFSEIQEEFETNEEFNKSLIRYNEQERLLREVKHLIYGADLQNLYSFDYRFKPKFSSDTINVSFNFGNTDELTNRVYALIGENGTGKTQLITSLPVNIAEINDVYFTPRIPLFSKVIAVSYSVFDTFEIPKKTTTFNYIYCGLRNEKGKLLNEKGLLLRFHNTWKRIRKMERMEQWRTVLLNFLDEEMIDEFMVSEDIYDEYRVSLEGFNRVRKKLSSGQSILLYIISQIVANIRYDSLLLFDEPETHLHPN